MAAKITILSFFLLSVFLSNLYSQEKVTSVQAPSIDGSISNSEWAGAKVITEYYCFSPKTAEKLYDSTITYIKNDKEALYIAFRYFPKGKVISKSLIRDRSTEDENEFFVLLDLENKNQNGYFFSFSFLNNQRDAQIYNQRNHSGEWDWVWYCKSTVHSEATKDKPGYIETELKIPLDKIPNKNNKQIGISLQFFSYTPDGSYMWYGLTPNTELLSLSDTYKYDLMTPFDEKLNLNISAVPYALGQKFNGTKYEADAGGDLNLTLDKHKLKLTVNTDESTIEADPFSFNLYNRATFLEEKRVFFSRDLDIYRTPINLFYTRAIQDIYGGANYTYRSDRFKVGAVYTEEQALSGIDPDDYRRRFGILRPNFNLSSDGIGNLGVGGLLIVSEDKFNKYKERIASVDANFLNLPTRLGGSFQYVNSNNELDGNSTNASAFRFDSYYLSNDAGGPFADFSYFRVNPNFFASTAFNSQVGKLNNYHEIFGDFGYKFKYDRKYFTDITFSTSYFNSSQIKDDGLLPAGYNFEERYRLNGNYKITGWLNFSHSFEYNMPNGVENGQVVKYKNFLKDFYARAVVGDNSFGVGYYSGTYFGTYLQNPYADFNLIFFNKVGLTGGVNYYDIGGEKTWLANTRLDYRIMDRLYFRTVYRYISTKYVTDDVEKDQLLSTLLQYEFFAGSNAYLVFTLQGNKLQNTARYFKLAYEFTL